MGSAYNRLVHLHLFVSQNDAAQHRPTMTILAVGGHVGSNFHTIREDLIDRAVVETLTSSSEGGFNHGSGLINRGRGALGLPAPVVAGAMNKESAHLFGPKQP